MEQDNMVLVRQAFEAICNHGDLDSADALFAPTYINHGGLIPDLVHGPESIKSGVALYRTAFPALHVTVDAMEAHDALVDVHWSARSHAPAAYASVINGAAEAVLTGTMRCRFAGMQIAESWMTWDSGAVLGHAGIIGPKAGQGENPDGGRARPSA